MPFGKYVLKAPNGTYYIEIDRNGPLFGDRDRAKVFVSRERAERAMARHAKLSFCTLVRANAGQTEPKP